MKVNVPPLAVYKSIADYRPMYADFVIRSGWFRTWYGVVVDYDAEKGLVAIAFEGTPRLLVTMYPEEVLNSTYLIKLSDIKRMHNGHWYIMQFTGGSNVWYV
jgi:hypothetical protein